MTGHSADIFTMEHLSFSYPAQGREVLEDLSLSIRPGEFVTLCGPSGCGKSTLLRQLKTVLAPHGNRSGRVLFQGRPLEEMDQREQAAQIGFVLQSPEQQIVTDKVWHELAFGLESLGMDTPTIRGRVAEMASFFGIESWFYKNVTELSGGQKQLLNLASVMAMQPRVLILDEPTSQLDPIAASDFLATVGKIHRELGTTVLLTEHRLEEVFPLSDRVLVMDKGRLICDGSPRQVGEELKRREHGMFLAMPAPMRLYAAVPGDEPCPITVRDGRSWLESRAQREPLREIAERAPEGALGEVLLELEELWFRYEQNTPDVVKGLSLSLRGGELFALLGGNGTGKSTALSLMAGLQKPYRGKVKCRGSIGVLPQNPQSLFVKKTVQEDLEEMLQGRELDIPEQQRRLSRVIHLCRLQELLQRHPYDLSGGEQQRAALAKVLLLQPRILLLDEPTKGLDAEFKQVFAQILQQLLRQGVAIAMVSHDLEFCAEYAQRCALFFDGSIVTEAAPRDFFSGNSFYTTSANRMARSLLPRAVTVEDVILACGGTVPEKPPLPPAEDLPPLSGGGDQAPQEKESLPLWRKILAGLSAAVVLGGMAYAMAYPDMTQRYLPLYLVILGAFFVLTLAVSRREAQLEETPIKRGKLSKRSAVAAAMILLLIPLTIYVGVAFLGDRKYYFISLLILLETMLPFFLIFEGRKPQARELVTMAALCALGVAGRAALFMLPQCKPVMALVIIAAVAFGGETGFLVGAVTMLVSNMMFSQGPWTPWQMFAMGIIGFLAGILFRKGLLRRSRLSLAIFGALASVVVYGGIMNPANVIIYQGSPTWPMILAAYITGFPMDLVQGLSTFLFLMLLSGPMLEKLDRIKVKYGLVE